jgi:hypothetical protein
MVIALFCIAALQLAVGLISEEPMAIACLVFSSWVFAAMSVAGGELI